MSTFSARLQQVRQERGFSRKEIAEILQVTPRAYQYYDEGKREPDYDKLILLSRHLNISADYLLGFTDKRYFFYHFPKEPKRPPWNPRKPQEGGFRFPPSWTTPLKRPEAGDCGPPLPGPFPGSFYWGKDSLHGALRGTVQGTGRPRRQLRKSEHARWPRLQRYKPKVTMPSAAAAQEGPQVAGNKIGKGFSWGVWGPNSFHEKMAPTKKKRK